MDQVVELHSSQRHHGHAVQLGVVEPVEEMDATRAVGGQAAAEPTGELRVATGHECGCLFVTHLHETHPTLTRAQRIQ